MWKFLILNILWFSILFLVHFVGSPLSRRFILFIIFAAAGVLAFQNSVDPLGWAYYAVYSLVVMRTASRFRQWASARSDFLDGEIRFLSGEGAKQKAGLVERENRTASVGRKADEIFQIYEKARAMSQSRDRIETFVIFGEALAQHTRFDSLKLVMPAADRKTQGPDDQEVYELKASAFVGLYDRTIFLRDRTKIKGRLTPVEEKAVRDLWMKKADVYSEEEPQGLTVFAVVLDKKIFAALLLCGCRAAGDPLLTILTHSFISEMQRLKLYERVQQLAITDGLTDVYVRRHLMERLQGEVDRCKRFGLKLSFLMIDVDFFKRFNDDYGHLVGDVVLKHVAATIKASTREVDLVGRYGGEEFGVLLVETDQSHAAAAAERIRSAIAERAFTAYDEILKVTISVGCATYSPLRNEAPLIVEAADAALYEAKHRGRNQVCVI